MRYQKQQGFTLIELVMVIVTLGILSAIAIPKFANTQQAARIAALNGTLGAMNAALSIVNSQAFMSNQTGATGTVTLANGQTVATVFGFPASSATGISASLNFTSANYTIAYGATSTFSMIGSTTPATCRITYTPATATTLASAAILTAGC